MWLLHAAVVTACAHSEPFRPGDYAAHGPLEATQPLRITYNLGQDRHPAWAPDGGSILYSRERTDRRDRDWCIAHLPAGGGAVNGELCDLQRLAADSIDAFTWSALGPDGQLAYARASAPLVLDVPISTPYYQELVVGTGRSDEGARVLVHIPYVAPSGRSHDGVAQIRWLGPSSLVYVAERVLYFNPCARCVDTVRTGLELVRLDFVTMVPVLATLPGTDQASSVAAVGADTVFFTVNGDSRVYRLILATDSVRVVHDFGSLGIARDVQVHGTRLLAVVGGDVRFGIDSVNGPVQRDEGGPLWMADLVDGQETLVTGLGDHYRHPVLDGSGRRVVAERLTGRTADLWLLDLP